MSRTGRRRAIARHGMLPSPGPVRQLMRAVGVTVAVVLVSGFGVAAYAAADLSSAFAEGAVELEGQDVSPPDIGELDDEGVNILFAGLDACEEEYKEYFPGRCDPDEVYGDDDLSAALNDVNMLMHISPEPRRVTVVSFPRDLMLAAPECAREDGGVSPALDRSALNEANSRGGLGCVVKTLEVLSGQGIDYAATVTWGGVIEISNAIGGVSVCVGGDGIYDEHTGLAIPPTEDYTLVGVEALEFLRTRHGVVGESDLSRISNQQVYMSALARKLTSEEVLSNPGALLTLARTTLENVRPTTSLTNPVTLVQVAMAASDVPLQDYTFVQYPVVEDAVDDQKVAPDRASAEVLWAALAENRPVELSGGAGHGAVLAEEETVEDSQGTGSEEDAAAPLPEEGVTPGEGAGESLPENVLGTDASRITCSAGRG